MSHPHEIRMRCDDPRDRYAGAQAAFDLAHRTGLPRQRCAAAAICAAELASNAARHGAGGVLVVRPLPDRPGVEIICRDRGPGFSSPSAALVDGWSKGKQLLPHDARTEGLGTGLGAIERLATAFHVTSEDGETIAVARIEE